MVETGSLLRKTPLHAAHVAAGARLVEFGGWEMPVQYTSILAEHAAVRAKAGLFDISHMGELRVRGPGAVGFLNAALTNNAGRIPEGGSQYSILLNERGGVVDDLFVYRMGREDFLLVVNASHIEEDLGILDSRPHDGVTIEDESAATAAMALQGPASPLILDRWITGASAKLGHHAIQNFSSDAGAVRIARTGYTGEDGFEILCPAPVAAQVWDRLLELGKTAGLIPCGLGARDTLRMEACYPLNGHELGPDITPLEAGLGFFVDFSKTDFCGKAALLAQKKSGVPRKAVALRAQAGTPPFRAGYGVFCRGQPIGRLTSGVLSPSLRAAIGLALIETARAVVGNSVDIEIRGQYFSASIVKKPIYRKSS